MERRILAIILLLAVDRGKSENIPFQALDCSAPTQTSYTLVKSLCQDHILQQGVQQKKQIVSILQENSKRVIRAIKCQLKHTNLLVYCGRYSHNKIFKPIALRVPQHLPIEACRKIAEHGVYQVPPSGRTITVELNRPVQYYVLSHGSISSTTDNVYCSGENLYFGGKQISDMLEYTTADLTASEVQLEYDGAEFLKDLTTNQKLKYNCISDRECIVPSGTYVIDDVGPECDLYLVRSIPMLPRSIPTEKGTDLFFVSSEHKILLQKGDLYTNKKCQTGVQVYNTDFGQLKIVISENHAQHVKALSSAQLDIDLEVRVVANFQASYVENLIYGQSKMISKSLCKLAQGALSIVEKSPFRPNAIIKILGEVFLEIQCTPVTVLAISGQSRDKECYRNALPVMYQHKPAFISPNTHMLIDQTQLNVIMCNESFTPMFRSMDNRTVIANPQIKVLNISIDTARRLHFSSEKEPQHSEHSDSVLYSPNEIAQFNDLLHFQRTKSELLAELTKRYCMNSNCAVQPTKQSSWFNMDHLANMSIPDPFEWISRIKRRCIEVGALCGLVFAIISATKLVINLANMSRLYFYKNSTAREAFNLTFNYVSHSRKEYIRDNIIAENTV